MNIVKHLLFLLLLVNFNIFAGTTGKIVGKIIDGETGEVLIGANVIIEGTRFGASTDTEGYFSIINIPPGTYNVIANYIGFAETKITSVNVSIDRTTNIGEIKLSYETVGMDEIVIQAAKPPIQKDRTFSASIVNSASIETMPVTSLQEVIELQPGVVKSGGSLHFRGGRSREVAYLIDGIPVTNDFSQGGGNNVAVENAMIEELEVISGTFNAEYGAAQSGIINIVTKRPSEKISGNFQIYSGEWLSNQNDIFLGVDDINPIAEKDVQFSLSGPVWRDKIGFFVNGRYNGGESLSW